MMGFKLSDPSSPSLGSYTLHVMFAVWISLPPIRNCWQNCFSALLSWFSAKLLENDGGSNFLPLTPHRGKYTFACVLFGLVCYQDLHAKLLFCFIELFSVKLLENDGFKFSDPSPPWGLGIKRFRCGKMKGHIQSSVNRLNPGIGDQGIEASWLYD